MPNFFDSPQIRPVSGYEPAGYDTLRNWLMNQIGSRSINPYGISPQGGQSNPLMPYGGRGRFDPYGGGGFGGGGYNPATGAGGRGGRMGLSNPRATTTGGGGFTPYTQDPSSWGNIPGGGQQGGLDTNFGGGGMAGGNMGGGQSDSGMAGQQQGQTRNVGSGGYSGAPQGPQGYSGGFGGYVGAPGGNVQPPMMTAQSDMAGGGQGNPLQMIMEMMRRRRQGSMGGGSMGPGMGQPSYDPYGGVGFSAYNAFQNSMGGGQQQAPGQDITPQNPSAPPGGPGTKSLFDGVSYDGPVGNPLPNGLPPSYGMGNSGNWGGPWGNGWAGPNGGPMGPWSPGAASIPNSQTPSYGGGAPPSTSSTMGATSGSAAVPSARPNQPDNSSYDWQWHMTHPSAPPPGSPPPPGGSPPPVRPPHPGGYDGTQYSGLIQNDGTAYSGLIQNDGMGVDGSVRFDGQPGGDQGLLMKLLALLHLSQAVPQNPKPAAPPPTPTPVPTPSDAQKREGQKGMDINTITKRADDIIDHDAQPYPNESSPMPDGQKVGHIHAPTPPRIPHAGKSALGGMLGGMASATHRGQMAANRVGRKGTVYDGISYDGGGSASPFPTGAQTAGAPMYPWMMPYQGQFTAPMSGAQNQGLSGAQNYVGGNPLQGATDYNNQLLSGGFMGSADPYLQQIRQGMQGTKNQQDADAQQQIASAMAAGGNALSGARLAANARYMDQSNNNFNTTMGNLEYGNLARSEALRNQGVNQAMGLTGANMGMYGNLMGMGAVPQQTEQHDLNSQYGDWVRQIQAMQQGDQQNTNNALNLLRTTPQSQNPQYGTSQASGLAALLSGLFGGGGNGGGGLLGNGGIGGLLSQLFGGGGSSGGGGSNPWAGQTTDLSNDPNASYQPQGFWDALAGNGDFGDQNMQDPYGGGGYGDMSGGYGNPYGDDWSWLNDWFDTGQDPGSYT